MTAYLFGYAVACRWLVLRFALWMGIFLGVIFSIASALAQESLAPQNIQAEDALEGIIKLLRENPELAKKLKAVLEQLDKEIKQAPPTVPGEPEIPPIEIPGPTPAVPGAVPGAAPIARIAPATLTPDIAVIGNNVGRFFSVRGDSARNRLQLGEFEIALEQPVYTGIRFKAQLAGGADEGFGIDAEEAYVTLTRVGKLPFGGLLGRKRLNFGKVNPIHPHARPYADQPAAVKNLVGTEALFGNGASINYLFPFKDLFANLELGLFDTSPAEEGITNSAGNFYPTGLGVTGNLPMARFWLSKAMGKAGELEIGASHVFGKAEIGDNISLTGADFTYRQFPGTFKRLQLQAEVFWHHRKDRAGGTGGHTRSGYYVLLTYRPDQYKEYGFRFDNAKFPWPLEGREQSYSLIWSDRLTEATLLRLQYKYGDRINDFFLPARRGYSEFYIQFIWGAGTHTHPLQ
jgi:hypothetical protein